MSDPQPDLSRLADKFQPHELEWRVGQAGKGSNGIWCKVLCYVTQRAIQDRLDEVCGPAGWQNIFSQWHNVGKPSQLCGIMVWCDGHWITKWDGAECTDIESVKGGLSDAMKRAAVQWGIGRYLYHIPETWADTTTDKQEARAGGWHYATLPRDKGGDKFYWRTPELPGWALPSGCEPSKKESGETPIDQEAQARADMLRAIFTRLKQLVGHERFKSVSQQAVFCGQAAGIECRTRHDMEKLDDDAIAKIDAAAEELIEASRVPQESEEPAK